MTTVVDADKAIELLERAVEHKGADYIDPRASTLGCEYADAAGQPLCIVGHVLSYLSVDLRPVVIDGSYTQTEELWGTDVSATELDLGDESKAPMGDVVFTSRAASVLGAAQEVQDGAGTWGDALEFAKGVA